MDRVLRIQDVLWLPAAEEWYWRADRPWRKLLGELLRKPTILMAGSASNYLSGKIIEEVFGGVAFSAPTNEYVGLWTAALDDTSTGAAASEATYTSYARTQVGTGNNQTDAWNAKTGTTTATVTNKNAITFPTSTGGSSTITYGMVADSGTTGAGNSLVWFSVTSTAIASGDTPKINASALSHVLDYGAPMALATLRVLEGSGDPGTGFTVDLQYDDALLRLTEVDINNNLTVNGQPASVFCMVVRDSDGRIYSRTFGQGQTTLSIPTGGAGRITVTLNSRGRLDGYSFGATYPV